MGELYQEIQMTSEQSAVKSVVRLSVASVLTALAVILITASGPMRAGWGVIGNSTNAGNTVTALMKEKPVQVAVASQLITEIKNSVSPQVAQQIGLTQPVLNSAIFTLMNNAEVERLVAQKVEAAYSAVQTHKTTVLDFSPLVNQATAIIHQIDPAIPAKIAGANKLNFTFKPSSISLSNVNSLGSGSVIVWLVGTIFLLLSIFLLVRSRIGKYVIAIVGYLVPAGILYVLAGVANQLVAGAHGNDLLAKAVMTGLAQRVTNSLSHTAFWLVLNGALVAFVIFGYDQYKARKSQPLPEVAN
jgi:hypothetical protein